MARISTHNDANVSSTNSDAQLLVLASLEDGPKHGHAIRQRVQAAYGKLLGPGALYGAINRLAAKGWIVVQATEGSRKPCKITDAGRDALRQSLATIRKVAEESADEDTQSPSYYERIDEHVIAAELAVETTKPVAIDRDAFAFTPLAGRRFEILAFLVTQKDAMPGEIVSLVKTSGDKGRDVLVHLAGRLKTVIQCKNLASGLSLLALQEELLKLVLHDYRERFIPEDGVQYELWAPGGLSEDAERFITSGPVAISQSDWERIFQRVTKKFTKLSSLQWDEVREHVQTSFARRIKIDPYNAIRITQRVKAHPPLCDQFFIVQNVFKKEDVESILFPKLQDIGTRIDQLTAASEGNADDQIDVEINRARDLINAGNRAEASMVLLYLRRNKGHQFSDRQEFRALSNEAAIDCAENRPEDGAQKFLKAVKLQPNDPKARENEVLAYYLRRELERTHQLAAQRRTELPESTRIAGLWINTAPADTPVADLEAALDPSLLDHHEVAVALARRWMQAHNLERAEALIATAKKSEPKWGQPWNLTAQVAIGKLLEENSGMRQVDPADRASILKAGIEAATKGLELSEKDGPWEKAEALSHRCQLHLLSNHVEDAAADAEQAYLLQSDDVGVLLMMAQCQLSLGALDKGIEYLAKAYKKEPRPDAAISYSRALAQRNKGSDLQKAAEVIVSLDIATVPRLFKTIVGMHAVVTLCQLASWSEAAAYLERARAVLDKATGLTLAAGLEHRKGNNDAARVLALEAKEHLEEDTLALTKELLAQLFVNIGDVTDAVDLLQELFDKRIPTFDPRQLLMCAYRLNDHKRILNACEELHKRGPMPWDVLEFEVQVLEQYDSKKAVARLQAFVAEHPDHKLALLRLSAIGINQNIPELIRSSLADMPAVDELPIEYLMPTLGILRRGQDSEKAIDYAYRFLRGHFDRREAHEAFIQIVISRADREAEPDLPTVLPGSAVYLEEKFTGQPRWFVLEDTETPVSAFEEITPKDPKTLALLGKKVGDNVVLVSASMANREATIKKIIPKYVRRFQDCMSEIDMRFGPSSMIQSVPMGGDADIVQPGLVALMTSVRERAELVAKLRKTYAEESLSTLHLYGANLSRNAYESIHDLAVTDGIPIKCTSGDPQEAGLALSILQERPGILLDLTSIATIRLLGLEWIFGTTTHRFFMTQGTWEELRETLLDDKISPGPSATITYEAGGFALQETDKAAHEVSRNENRAFLDNLQSHVEIIPATALAERSAEERTALVGYLGTYGAETVAVAPASNLAIWSDDLMQAEAAKHLLGGKRVWTQVVLISLTDAGVLSKEDYYRATAKLIGMGYTSTFFDATCVFECARLAEYRPGRFPLKQMISVFATTASPAHGLVKILLEFFVLLQQQPLLFHTKLQIVAGFLDALWSNPHTHAFVPAIERVGSRFFGLNVIAESEFKAAFTEWKKTLANRQIGEDVK